MLSRLATLIPVAALVAVAAAAPGSSTSSGSSGSTTCSNGTQMCCNSSQYTSGFGITSLGSLVSLLDGTTVLAGLTCDPITVIGALTGSSCTQQTVCCTGNTSNSLIDLSCNNIAV